METEDVVHVLRNVHRALRPDGHVIDAHPLGFDIPIRGGSRGLGFVDAHRFAQVVAAMDAVVDEVIAEGLFEDVRNVRRYVVERFDDAADLLEHAESWNNLRLPGAVRRRLRGADERPVELVDAIAYRLMRKRDG